MEIGLDPNFNSFINFDLTLLSSATFIGLSANTTYYMQVEAINQGAQATSFTILPPAHTFVTAPGAPVLTASQITDTSITWSWTSSPNAFEYFIINDVDKPVSGTFGAPVPWTETNLGVNSLNERRVVARNAREIASNSITIGWDLNGNPPPPATQYAAQISDGKGFTRQIDTTNLEALFDHLEGATTYFFSVKAVNGAGAAAAAGNILLAATLPQTATSNQFCPSDGAALAFNGPNGRVSVSIPAGAFLQCVAMQVSIPGFGDFPNAPSSGTPMEGTGVGIQVQIVNDPAMQPLHPITLTVPFTGLQVTNDQRNQLVLARYDTVHNLWIMLHSTVDRSQNTVTAETDHFSLFQVMVALPAGNLSNIRVYPNPFRPALGQSGVNFTNLRFKAFRRH